MNALTLHSVRTCVVLFCTLLCCAVVPAFPLLALFARSTAGGVCHPIALIADIAAVHSITVFTGSLLALERCLRSLDPNRLTYAEHTLCDRTQPNILCAHCSAPQITIIQFS